MAGFTINPALASNAPNTFGVQSSGFIAGTAQNDPAVRNELKSAVVNLSATTPMWGGNAVVASTPTLASYASTLRNVLALATAASPIVISGFTVFDQSNAMINTPQSPVPLAPAGGAINFYPMGSGARIAVPCSSTVALALQGASDLTAVYWDYTNQALLTSAAGGGAGGGALPVQIVDVDSSGNSQVVSYSSGTGFATWNYSGYAVVIRI